MHQLPAVVTTSSFPLPDAGGLPQTTPGVVGAYIAAVFCGATSFTEKGSFYFE
jgi:hypothetical protein